jgi:hypothetical protein
MIHLKTARVWPAPDEVQLHVLILKRRLDGTADALVRWAHAHERGFRHGIGCEETYWTINS